MAHVRDGLDPAIGTRPQSTHSGRTGGTGDAVVVANFCSSYRACAMSSRRSRAGRGRAGGAGSSRRSRARKPVRLAHGIERVDDYAWLRDPNWRDVIQDPSRLAPDIRTYLDAKTATRKPCSRRSDLRVKLVEEMKGRIGPDVPVSRCPTVPTPIGANTSPVPSTRASCGRRAAAGRADPARRTRAGGDKSYFSFGEYHHIRTTACAPTPSTRPAPRATTCASAISAPGATCRGHSEVTPSPGRATAARCSTSGSTTSIARASSTATGWAATRARPARLRGEGLGFGVLSTPRSGRFVVISTEQRYVRDMADRRRAARKRPQLVVAREPGLRYYLDDWATGWSSAPMRTAPRTSSSSPCPRRRRAARTGAIWCRTRKAGRFSTCRARRPPGQARAGGWVRAAGDPPQGGRQRAYRRLRRRGLFARSRWPYEFDTAPSATCTPRRRRRGRPSTTTWRAASGCCASSRASRAATTRPPMWCGGSRSRPPTTSRCRSRCCTATCRSTARRLFLEAMAPTRVPDLVRCQRAVARRPRFRLRIAPSAADWRR